MKITRRKFLLGCTMVAAGLAIPFSDSGGWRIKTFISNLFRPAPPILWGDGIHDDSDAFQAWANGNPVIDPQGNPVDRLIGGHRFLISKTIHIQSYAPVSHLDDCILDFSAAPDDPLTCFHFHFPQEQLANIRFSSPSLLT